MSSAEAERRDDGDFVAIFGGPSGAKYTLGGWSTHVREVVVDETPSIVSSGTSARMLVPIEASATHLTLRLKTFRPGTITVYVDGETLGSADAPTEFEERTFELSGIPDGEHLVQVRASRSATVPGLGRAGVAIDWLRVGAATVPPTPFAQGAISAAGVLRWPVMVPPDARLEIDASGPVQVRILRDGEPPRVLGEPASELRVPLEYEGELVAVELSATSEVTLERALLTVPQAASRRLRKPTNVLLFLIDTLRADELAPYRPDTRVRTPHLGAFASAATTFDHAHAQENWTKPSVATLLTSLMPWEHEATQHESVLPRSVQLLPEVLKEHGFETASFICNGFVSDRFGFKQGWDTYRNYIREGRRTRSQFVAADVLEWLDARGDTEQPFFLYVHTIDPHVPYRPPDEFVAMYGDTSYSGVVDFSRDATLLENIKLGRLRLNDVDRAHLRALYDAEVSYHDVHFGAILDGLERRGIDESTLVIVTSDHGEEFWDHGSVGHGHSVYEELLHVPMFVRIPGEAPRRVTTPVGLVDVMPTILEALELPVPAELSGRSFFASLQGNRQQRGTVSGFMENWRTFTIGRYKLIERPGNRSAVYDLHEDPSETQDISEQRPLLRRALRSYLGMRLAETRSEAPTRRRAAPSRPIDSETAAQLRALGYIVD